MILLFILINSAFGLSPINLNVDSPSANYSLKLSEKSFEFNSGGKNIARKITKCDRRAYQNFSDKLTNALENDPLKSRTRSPAALEATYKKRKMYYRPLSKGGLQLAKVETDVDYLISEAIYRCSKK